MAPKKNRLERRFLFWREDDGLGFYATASASIKLAHLPDEIAERLALGGVGHTARRVLRIGRIKDNPQADKQLRRHRPG